jgi:crotonobetainyl-CoA:carnitine CoA-transferase CaiB-like acyl-CoA transferase
VAGPVSATGEGGLVDAVRGDQDLRRQVSTADSVELAAGRIAAVMALAEQARGGVGSYGVAAGADAPIPSPSPS